MRLFGPHFVLISANSAFSFQIGNTHGRKHEAAMTQALTGTHRPLQGANQSAMVAVARKSGISPLRQFAEIWRLGRGAGRIAVGEYYGFQLWRRDLTDKRNFLGERGSLALNLRLAPPEVCHMRNFLGDKLAFTLFAQGLGLPTTETLAAYHPTRSFGALARLRGAAEIAPLPLFGKPIRGQQARGALRCGKTAAEIAAEVEGGYLFQTPVAVAPEIRP
jgi:hypothetical protein